MEGVFNCLLSLSTVALTTDGENHNKYSPTIKCDENGRGFRNLQVCASSTVGSGAACKPLRVAAAVCLHNHLFFY